MAEIDAPRAPARTDGNGLASNIIWSLGGQIGYVAAQMAVLSALGRLRGAEAIGEFGLALAITTPIFMLAGMGVRTGQATDVRDAYAFSEYASLVVAGTVVATVLSVGLGYTMAEKDSTFTIIAIVSAMKAFESISKLAYGAFQQAARMELVAGSLLVRGILTVAAFVALLWAGVETEFAFLAQLAVWSVMALVLDYPLACRISSGGWVWPSPRLRRVATLARESAPIGGSQFISSLLISLPRIAVERFFGLEAAGYFTVIGYFQQAATLIITGVSQVLINRFARLRRDGDATEFSTTLRVLAAIALFLSTICVGTTYFFGEWVLGKLFGPEFREAADLLLLIALAVSIKLFAILPESVMHADRRFGAVLVQQLASLALCVALLGIFFPTLGLMGAGYVVLVVAMFRLAMLAATAWSGTSSLTGGGKKMPASTLRVPAGSAAE